MSKKKRKKKAHTTNRQAKIRQKKKKPNLMNGRNPNEVMFNTSGCFDTGPSCGGWGHVMVKMNAELISDKMFIENKNEMDRSKNCFGLSG